MSLRCNVVTANHEHRFARHGFKGTGVRAGTDSGADAPEALYWKPKAVLV
jgi:hypothetical protein